MQRRRLLLCRPEHRDLLLPSDPGEVILGGTRSR